MQRTPGGGEITLNQPNWPHRPREPIPAELGTHAVPQIGHMTGTKQHQGVRVQPNTSREFSWRLVDITLQAGWPSQACQ